MAIPTTTLGTTKPVENDLSIDSIPWGAPLLNNHSGVAVVWGVYGTTNLRVNLVSPGGTVGPTGYLLMGATMDANSSFHVAAAGPDRFVVLGDDGDDANPPFTAAYMRIFDTNGNTMSPTFSLGNYRYYDVKGVADGTFIVTWFNDDPGIQRFFYTHYTKDGNPIAGQTNKQFQAPTNVALLSVAGDTSGGFMYSTPASTTSTDGSQLKYVDAAGNETLVTTVGAGYRGTLAYDGTNFWFFYVNSSQVYATKISGAGHTVIGNYTLTGFTSNQEPSVTMTPDGSFLLTDHPSTGNPKTVAKVSSAGAVLETYAIPSTDFVIVAPTTDNGALLVRNYAGSNGLYQLDVSESFESAYLDALPPTITAPAALSFADTSANDTLVASAAATLAITSDTTITGRGIQGGTTGISKTIGSVTYDVSKAGTYGTLYLKSSTGEYSYEPNNPAINALSANASDSFTVTANNANGSGTATLTVNITGVNDLPLVANLSGTTGTFKAGMANPTGDRIAPATVSVTDVDSANLAGGYLQINLTGGTNDGSFYADPTKVKGGTDSVLSAGDAVYVDVTGTGSSYVQIGTVAASGGVLHIDFNASATPANVTWLLKYLAYNAYTTGQRDFNLVLNDGDGGTSASYAFSMVGTDGTAPTLSSSSPADNATAVLTNVTPTIVFSEAVQFGTGKIYLVDVASNTVVEQFDVATAQGVGDGKVSISTTTLTINPTASLDYGKTYAIKIDSGAVTDLAGNAYAGISDNTTLNFTTNSAPPTVTISASATPLKAGQHATITFTFNSAPTGFTAADITATGGTISALTVNGSDPKIYTADFAPAASQSLNASIQVAAGAFTDASSQLNVASNVLSITGDTLAPTITSITRDTPTGATTNADTLVFQVQFSEAVSNLDATDFSVSGTTATVSSVTVSGTNSYAVTVTGGDLATLNGAVGLAVSAGNDLADGAGNALGSTTPTGANQSYTIDNTVSAPALALGSDTGSSNSDGITKDGTINVTLAADVASWEYSVDGGAHWTAGSGTSFALGAGSYGAGTVQVRQTDTAGNLSTAASNAAAITIDTSAAAPSFALHSDSGASNSDGISRDGTIDVTLPLDAASWEYSTDGGAHWTAGSATAFTLADGSYAAGAVKVRYTDTAGNLSTAAANAAAITIDNTVAAPALALADDTGTSNSDGITNNKAVNVTLAADVASWEYSTDGGAHWSAGSGTSFNLNDGTYAAGTVQVRQTDIAGNLSAAGSNAAAITIDTTALAPALALATDSGASATDGITKDGTVNVTLPLDAASWEYSVDGGAHWSAGSGTSFGLAVGDYASGAVQARYTDKAGNLSAAGSNGAAITVDTSTPSASFALAADTGANNSDGITKNPTVNVTLPPDAASWEYSVDGGGQWNTGSGTSFSLAEGSYASGVVLVRYTDVAGNLSPLVGKATPFTIDTSVAAPSLALAADTGTSNSDGITKDGTINVTLAADAASWEYSVDGGAHWSTGSGTSFVLAAGSYSAGAVQVRQTDVAGNLSTAASNAAAITVDTTAAAPSFALHSDSGASASDGVSRDGTIDVTLPVDAASWEYSTDSGAHWTAGSATAFTLADGSYAAGAVKVRYTDTAGNLSTAGVNAAAITIDNTVAAPALALAADTGVSNSDGLTRNTAVNVTLAADVDSWEYSTDSGAHWTSGSGTSFNLGDGTYAVGSVQVRQTDVAGNLSASASNAATITIDTTALAPALALATDSGAGAADGITKDGTVNVTLPLDAASWEYSVDNGGHWSAGSGTSFTLVAGIYASGAVQARYTDTAGNLSAAGSNGAAITVDTTAAAPSLALAADTGASNSDSITNNPAVNVTLPVDAASWEYSVDGGAHWSTGSGTSFNLPAGVQAAGQVQVRYTDVAGNLSAAGGNAAAITIDTSVAAPAQALAADTGTSNSDGITKDGTINVTLAADVASWEYSVDGGAHWSTGSGTSFVLAAGSYGAGAVQVRQTDVAGNLSAAASNAAAITVDTTAAAPSFALHSDSGASNSDGISRDGTIDVTLPLDAASWEYSTDGGAHWTAGSATAFTLADGSYAAGAVKVRYTDTAGNLSAAAANAAAIAIDNTVAAPALALAADTGTSNSDGITNNKAVNVTLAADVASWEYSADGGAHWNAGSGTSFNLNDGTYAAGTVQVRQTDVAGNLSAAGSNAAAITIDTTALAPALALATDSGASAADGITKDGTVNVTLPLDAASWEYSVDSGSHWSAGSGTSFILAEGSYAAGTVQVRYTDNAGNLSAAAGNASTTTVDHTVAAPALALAADTGSSGSDGLTSNGAINVTLASDASSWEYSIDGGAHWSAGTGTAFALPEGSYAAGMVQVRQTDLAGNTSAAAGNAAAISIDTTAAAPVIGLAADTGVSASDGITSNGRVNISTALDAASWEYSTDAGAHWTAGSGSSFVLGAGTWASGAVQVRYTDNAGNLSTSASNASAITVDLTAPAPTLALEQDNGDNATDGITTNPLVHVTLPADAASWEYSINGGANWSPGHGVNFGINPGKHIAGMVQVRYTDLAGNVSPSGQSTKDYFIMEVAPPVTPPGKTTIDGVMVETSEVRNSDGTTSQVMVVPVVVPSRVDETGGKEVADIPLATTSGGAPVLTAQLPTGYGMQVTGSAAPEGTAAGLAELTRDIQAHTSAGSPGQASMMAAGANFLGGLAPGASLVVQAITPTVTPGGQPSAPMVIAAPPAAPNQPLTAVVIDSSNVPGGASIQLQNVHFAALIGPMHVTGGDGSQVVFGDAADQYIVLGADDDILHGGAGNDTVGSAGGNDRVYGDEGNDVVFGGAGNDYLDGGTGTDVVLLQGASRADYSLRFDHGNLVATQLHGGPDGTDTIANVEVLRFAGAHPDMGTDASLRRIYDTLFDRPADAAGAAWWSAAASHGMALHDIAASLLASGEAKGPAGLANAAFVDQLYRDALGTGTVPADERARWIGLLDQGKADRADVLLGIANGTQKLALDAQEHSDVAFADTDAATIVRLYVTVFGRHADEAGVNFWIGSSEAGMAMHDIVNAFLQSTEAQQRYGGTSDNQFIDTLYSVGFGRHANASEIGFWADKLHAGAISRADLVLYFADSPEQVTLVGNSTTIAGLTG